MASVPVARLVPPPEGARRRVPEMILCSRCLKRRAKAYYTQPGNTVIACMCMTCSLDGVGASKLQIEYFTMIKDIRGRSQK